MKNFPLVAVAVFGLCSFTSTVAAQILMSGTYAFQRNGGLVTYGVERIENFRPLFTTSGTLSIQLWACAVPYTGGTLVGYKLTETALGTLSGGYYLSNVVRTQTFIEPPAGTYWIVFVLAEWNGYSYVIVDFGNFNTPNSFGPILLPPAFVTQPQNLSLIVGQSGSFAALLTGTPPLYYQWRKNGVAIPGATGSTLSFGSVQVSDAGNYTVFVTNAVGSALSNTVTLSVTSVAPTFVAQPRSISVSVGQSASFSAQVAGTPPFSYQWRKNGVTIPGASAPTISLGAVQLSDAGDYAVLVTNSAGSVLSNLATLSVTSVALTFVAQPQNVSVSVGQSAAFSVQVTGTPPFSYQWRKNSAMIPGATGATISLGAVQLSDGGEYAVLVTNPSGSVVSNSATLSVNPVEPTARLSNLSVRAMMNAGQTLTVGVVVSGGARDVLVRAIGPALGAFGLTSAMRDPRLDLFSGQTVVFSNDDWPAALAPTFSSVGAFALPAGGKDAAFVRGLDGAYTIQTRGTDSGVVLVEAYDIGTGNTPRLVNVSARSRVGTDDNILIAGFCITGSGSKRVLIRAIGPGLVPFGVAGTLADPKLEVFTATGTKLAENDTWSTELNATFASVGAFSLPNGSRDAALLTTLAPGSYSAQVKGADGGTGEALVEVYEVP